MNKIIEKNRKEIEALCKTFHVQALEVFGSAVRDDKRFDLLESIESNAVALYAA